MTDEKNLDHLRLTTLCLWASTAELQKMLKQQKQINKETRNNTT